MLFLFSCTFIRVMWNITCANVFKPLDQQLNTNNNVLSQVRTFESPAFVCAFLCKWPQQSVFSCTASPCASPQCSRSCNSGYRVREVRCLTDDIVPSDDCHPISIPESREECNKQPCLTETSRSIQQYSTDSSLVYVNITVTRERAEASLSFSGTYDVDNDF